MKQRTKDLAHKWLETAKTSDTFVINTVHHSKSEVEEMLGIKPPKKHKEQINKIVDDLQQDIEVESYGDMEQEHDSGHTEESGD